MARTSPKIILDETSILELSELVKNPPNEQIAKRASIILECGRGCSNSEVAAIVGMDAHYVSHWRQVYLDSGINGLQGQHGGGVKPSISQELSNLVDSLIAQDDADWTVETLSKETGATTYAISELLRRKGVNLQRNRRWAIPTKDELLEKNADIVGIFLAREEQAFIVCSSQAPMVKKQGKCITRNRLLSEECFAYNGDISLSALIHTAAWHANDITRQNDVTLSDFTASILDSLPRVAGLEYHLFVHTESKHIYRGNNLSGVYVNRSQSNVEWMAQVGSWITGLSDTNDAAGGLLESIQEYVSLCGIDAIPFVWHKDVDTEAYNEKDVKDEQTCVESGPSLEDELKAVLRKHLAGCDDDSTRCGFISFVYDHNDIQVHFDANTTMLPPVSRESFSDKASIALTVTKLESAILDSRNQAGITAAEMAYRFVKKKAHVNGICKPIKVDGELGQMLLDVPAHIACHFRTDEHLRTGGLGLIMCHHAIHSSYRLACLHVNQDLHRYTAGCPIPEMSFFHYVMQEGKAYISAVNAETERILEAYGFGKDGLLPPGKELDEKLQNTDMERFIIDPVQIMQDAGLTLPSATIAYINQDGNPVYSQPETGLNIHTPHRRGTRKLVPDEYRESTLISYVHFVNTLPDRDPRRMVLKPWSFEKYSANIVNIYIDAVLVAEQESTRVKGGKSVPRTKRTNVVHYDIRIETENGGRYNITSIDMDAAFCQTLAVLLDNHLTTKYFQFFVDGETILFDAIKKYFKPWYYAIFLDFHHVEEKSENLLSSAIRKDWVTSPWKEPELYKVGPKKGQIKKEYKVALSRTYASVVTGFLWYGNVDCAIDYLEHIDPADVTDPEALQTLIDYFRNKGQYITCYALRARVGLKNSSNSSELANELMVSARQKVDGRMHWIENGSANLAAITSLFCNEHEDLWFTERKVSFALYYKNATPSKIEFWYEDCSA